jgi:hypothetical protein
MGKAKKQRKSSGAGKVRHSSIMPKHHSFPKAAGPSFGGTGPVKWYRIGSQRRLTGSTSMPRGIPLPSGAKLSD